MPHLQASLPRRRASIALIAGLALLLTVLGGCGSGPAPLKTRDTVWPARSKTPLLRYLATITNDLDATGLSFADRAFGPQAKFQFSRPTDALTDKRGNLYVSDAGLASIVSIRLLSLGAAEGSLSIISPESLRSPAGLGYSAQTDILAVADPESGSVHLFHLPEFSYVDTLGKNRELKAPMDAAFDSKRGLIYVADWALHQVAVFEYSGAGYRFIRAIGHEGRDAGEFFMPTSVEVDSAGNVYVVDSSNFRVQVIGPDHAFKATIGKHGRDAGGLSKPFGIALDSRGRVFVTDTNLRVLQIFEPEGRAGLRMGNEGTGKKGSLAGPMGVHVDAKDRVYVVDRDSRRIQVYQALHPEN